MRYFLLFIGAFLFQSLPAQIPQPGMPLPPWQPGYLDIHHINTGRGNASFFIFPDGTNLLLDAGELDPTEPRTTSARNTAIRPNGSQRPFEWVADYIRQFSPQKSKTHIDYALITHFHEDHFGGWYPGAPASSDGTFKRSGITGIGDIMTIHTLLTRDYHYPVDPDSILKKMPANSHFTKSWTNYMNFISSATVRGMKNDFLRAGSATQIHLVHDPGRYPTFQIRNLKSNGDIWTGTDSSTKMHFPKINLANPQSWPDENTLSNAILVSYGGFRYYTGGDNPGNVFLGDSSWRDTETPMARVIGQVDIATMDHHGNRDAVNEDFIKALQPRVWVEQVWTADHPGHEVLIRLMSKLYDGPRDLFATNMMEANKLVIGPLVDSAYKSQQGHILVRVLPDTKTYYIITLDDTTSTRNVKGVFGPYQVKKSGMQ